MIDTDVFMDVLAVVSEGLRLLEIVSALFFLLNQY
jgi:hypothetical protein